MIAPITPIQPPPPGVSPEIHRALYEAIATLHVIEIEQGPGQKRIGEPHDYGIRNGKPALLLYQFAGYTSSGRLPCWRNLDPTSFRAVRPLNRTFHGGRTTETGQHREWDQLFIRATA
jgi:hypothetical protein